MKPLYFAPLVVLACNACNFDCYDCGPCSWGSSSQYQVNAFDAGDDEAGVPTVKVDFLPPDVCSDEVHDVYFLRYEEGQGRFDLAFGESLDFETVDVGGSVFEAVHTFTWRNRPLTATITEISAAEMTVLFEDDERQTTFDCVLVDDVIDCNAR